MIKKQIIILSILMIFNLNSKLISNTNRNITVNNTDPYYKEVSFADNFNKNNFFFKSKHIAHDNQGNIYTGENIKEGLHIFSKNGKPIKILKLSLNSMDSYDKFSISKLIICNDEIFIGTYKKIYRFNFSGHLLNTIKVEDKNYTIASNGDIYSLDLSRTKYFEKKKHKIKIYNKQGKLYKKIFIPKRFKKSGIIDMELDKKGNLCILYHRKIFKIEIISQQGKIYSDFKNNNIDRLFCFALDQYNNVYISEAHGNKPLLKKYNKTGKLLYEYSLKKYQPNPSYITDIKVDKQENVYLVDYNNQALIKINKEDDQFFVLKSKLTNKVNYHEVRVGADLNIYLKVNPYSTRRENYHYIKFSPQGKFLKNIKEKNLPFFKRNNIDDIYPHYKRQGLSTKGYPKERVIDCEKDQFNNIYILYAFYNQCDGSFFYKSQVRLLKFNSKRKFLFKLYLHPGAIDIETDKKGNIYIANQIQQSISIYNKKGHFLHEIKSNFETVSGEDFPWYGFVNISLDKKGNIYAVDQVANKIKKFKCIKNISSIKKKKLTYLIKNFAHADQTEKIKIIKQLASYKNKKTVKTLLNIYLNDYGLDNLIKHIENYNRTIVKDEVFRTLQTMGDVKGVTGPLFFKELMNRKYVPHQLITHPALHKKKYVEPLLKKLNSDSNWSGADTCNIISLLGYIGKPAVKILIKALTKSTNTYVQRDIIIILGGLKDKEATVPIIKAYINNTNLTSKPWKKYIVDALIHINDPNTIPLLEETYKKSNTSVKKAIRYVINKIEADR